MHCSFIFWHRLSKDKKGVGEMILNYLQSALYLIMNALLYPVMALLLVFFIWILMLSGGFVSEWLFRKRIQRPEWLAAKLCNEISHAAYNRASKQIYAYIEGIRFGNLFWNCLLYTSDAADE